jgi:hypothetical protein
VRAADVARYEPILKQADAAFVGPKLPARLAAMAAVHQATLDLGNPARADDGTQAWWFVQLRQRLKKDADPEVTYFLETELRFTPEPKKPAVMQASASVTQVPYQAGEGTMASLADTARSLDLGERPRLAVDQLRAMATDKKLKEEESDRALILLRRMNPAAAVPLLWERLQSAKKRSEVMSWEEQLMRVPVQSIGKVAYDEKWSAPVKAAWLRIASSRSQLPVTVPDRNGWLELLKGPANENTEAAWDAVPRVFKATDRADLEAIAKTLPERLAPRAKLAIGLVR